MAVRIANNAMTLDWMHILDVVLLPVLKCFLVITPQRVQYVYNNLPFILENMDEISNAAFLE
jgi:hypothetical protein